MNTAASSASRLEKKLLHYTGRCIHRFNLIERGDRVLVCLSGGKDSFGMLHTLETLRKRSGGIFSLHSLTLDQGQPGWDDRALKAWLHDRAIEHTILTRDTYSIVKEKTEEGQTYCVLCSRLRRGIIYRFALEHGFQKIALGHHRDDMIHSLLMSIFYNGQIASMPPKLLSDDRRHIIIRPLAFCQEKDLAAFAQEQNFPIIPCSLCGSQENLVRKQVKAWVQELAAKNPKIPSNILHALSSVRKSQLMDESLWNFKELEKDRV